MSRYTDEQTHHIMRSVHSKNTNIEVALRKELWRQGYRYRKNVKTLPGKPDIVFTKYKLAIFCDSEFWHGKDWEVLRPKLSRGKNPDFWVKKIERNRQRDVDEERSLRAMGYTVLRFWGKDILSRPEECVQIIVDTLFEIKMQKYEDSIETELIKRDQESN
mgnify:FL=1